MLSLLRRRLFRKHYDKLISSKKKKSKRPSINTISSVTILIPAKHHTTNSCLDAMRFFENMGIVCHIYLFKEKKEIVEIATDINIIDEQEGSWYGVPSQQILIHWLRHKTDLLIFSNPDDKLLMKYLCAASNSKLKTTADKKTNDKKDRELDIWVEHNNGKDKTILSQCQLIYDTLIKIGIKPPVIG